MSAPQCLICAKRPATYVCQDCGRAVCGNCFDPAHWSCLDCQTKLRPTAISEYIVPAQFSMATWLFFISFAIIFIGILLMTVGSLSNLGGVSGGAVILIGPIPIVLGAGPYSAALVGFAIVLTIFALAFFFVMRKRAQA